MNEIKTDRLAQFPIYLNLREKDYGSYPDTLSGYKVKRLYLVQDGEMYAGRQKDLKHVRFDDNTSTGIWGMEDKNNPSNGGMSCGKWMPIKEVWRDLEVRND